MGLILAFATAWIICGLATFLFFTYALRRIEKSIGDKPELIPELLHIYGLLEGIGMGGFLAGCLLIWPLAVSKMLTKRKR